MRFLYVSLDRGIPVGGTKGASVHVAELLRALEADGHETALLVRHSMAGPTQRPLFTAAVADGMGWIPGSHLRRDVRELRAGHALRGGVRAAIAEFGPDVIYERYALFRSETGDAAARAGVPLVLEVNAPLAWEERRFRHLILRRAAERAELQSWRSADLVVVPSRPLERLVRATGQEHVLVVPNAVDVERFDHPVREDLRRELGLENRFVVGFVGSVRPWHDFETLAAAVRELPADMQPALLLVGRTPADDELGELRREARVELVAVGPVSHEQVGNYLGIMDVCVASLPADPQLHYFSPLKVLEYLAAGRPTVVADAGDLRTIAAAGVALAYRPGDVGSLAAQLLLVASDAETRARLSRAGPEYARARTWRDAARTIAQAAERLRRTDVTA
jgi:glycosyltransferase involved in cell wall biosynthesis